MEKIMNERRSSSRISFSSQPTIMLTNAELGSFSATLVDLSADGMCLNTDAPFLPGTRVKAYFPDHRGPTVKARVVRNWSDGLALIVPGRATKRLRGFVSRLMGNEQQVRPVILNRSAAGGKHAALGLTIITSGFMAAFVALLLIGSPAAAGLAGLIVMATVLTGDSMMNQTRLNDDTVRRAIMLAATVALLGLLFRSPTPANSTAGAWPWLTALIFVSLYLISYPFEIYLNSRKRPDTHN